MKTKQSKAKPQYNKRSVSKRQIRKQVKKSKQITEKDLPYSDIDDLIMDLSERWR